MNDLEAVEAAGFDNREICLPVCRKMGKRNDISRKARDWYYLSGTLFPSNTHNILKVKT